jgi:hypothetical protein
MPNVTNTKDLGSGVIGGTECDHFAFRTQDVDVDWQIWITQGDQPHPCRYVITSKQVDRGAAWNLHYSVSLLWVIFVTAWPSRRGTV